MLVSQAAFSKEAFTLGGLQCEMRVNPVRFRVEAAAGAQFSQPIVIVDCTGQDYKYSGWVPISFDAQGKTARYVCLVATKLWQSGKGQPVLTLGEFEVFAGAGNIAAGAAVEGNESVEGYGWYALSKDLWVHGLERSPFVDLPKLRFDLVLTHADGSETQEISDESWQWSTGEITRSWIPEEDVDLRKQSRDWRPVVSATAPRGRLTHQKEPFNHVVEEFHPPTMTFDAQTGTATYELGREVNGHVRFQACGPEGTTLNIATIPTAPHPRTRTFILAGTGAKEIYEPRFFHEQ